ncbi:MAG: glucoamylase family protein [Gemmatimonadota bacterium]
MPATLLAAALAMLLAALAGCRTAPQPQRVEEPPLPTAAELAAEAFLDTLQQRTFDFFWETTPPENGLTPDRWPTPSFSSIAAVGFALTAYLVGVENGWITRAEAADRTLSTLLFFWDSPHGPETTGVTGYKGFFYHFLDMETGHRFERVELSSIDTTLLLAGILSSQVYFDGQGETETAIRAYADSLYRRVDWPWMQARAPSVAMAWRPERGFGQADWEGYNEAMILLILALGSPTHPVGPEAWHEWTRTYRWGEFYGQEHIGFAPLFGHQYSHVWIDFRGIQDSVMRFHGIDYFENSRRATNAQREYAIDNPNGWQGYGPDVWGLTASDGPADTTVVVDGRERVFHTYWARGAGPGDIRDDGTIVPTAAGGSLPFAPRITIRALMEMRRRFGDHLFDQYGFRDAFNLTFDDAGIPPAKGEVVPEAGWFDDDYLGIDQGPILIMIENHRTGFVWDLMKESPYIVIGLCRAGFSGGWLEGRCPAKAATAPRPAEGPRPVAAGR